MKGRKGREGWQDGGREREGGEEIEGERRGEEGQEGSSRLVIPFYDWVMGHVNHEASSHVRVYVLSDLREAFTRAWIVQDTEQFATH